MKTGTLLIRADANVSTGIGHVMRCLALAQAWQDAVGNAFFAIAEIPEALALRLKSNGFALLPIEATPGGSLDASATVAHASQLRADWVVVDGDRFSDDFCDRIRASSFRLLLIDDFAERETFSADLIVNPNFGAEVDPYRVHGCTGDVLAGVQYVLLQRAFQESDQKKLKKNADRILVTLGGSDPDNLTLPVAHALDTGCSDLQLTVVAGPGYANLNELHKLNGANLKIVVDPPDIAELMKDTDLAVIAAGGTLWELLSLGRVVLSYSRNAMQRRVVESLERCGVLSALGEACQFDPVSLIDSVKRLCGAAFVREQMSSRGRALVDGLGASRVVEALQRCGAGRW